MRSRETQWTGLRDTVSLNQSQPHSRSRYSAINMRGATRFYQVSIYSCTDSVSRRKELYWRIVPFLILKERSVAVYTYYELMGGVCGRGRRDGDFWDSFGISFIQPVIQGAIGISLTISEIILLRAEREARSEVLPYTSKTPLGR